MYYISLSYIYNNKSKLNNLNNIDTRCNIATVTYNVNSANNYTS